MAQRLLFDRRQRGWVGDALEIAEGLAGDYFKIDLANHDQFPFDLETLENLAEPEKTHRALAQVCKYKYEKRKCQRKISPREFYRICLQDDKILSRVRVETEELLRPLLLYVITHELIHVIRFSMEPTKFHLGLEGKKLEEKSVHRMTHEVLESIRDPNVETLLERYRPHWEGEKSHETKPLILDKSQQGHYF